MAHCRHCGIQLGLEPFIHDGVRYCCKRCFSRARRIENDLAAREAAYLQLMESLVRALDSREHETANHSQRVARYTHFLARLMDIDPAECMDICRGALLHDIGKIGIPDAILLKRGQLSEEEWKVMRTHPAIGRHIVEGIGFLAPVAELIYAHHERYDGSGYPRGLKGEAIPVGARIFAVADAIDALTSERSYHRAQSLDSALRKVKQESGSAFDPQVVVMLNQHREPFAALLKELKNTPAVTLDAAALAQDVRRVKYNR